MSKREYSPIYYQKNKEKISKQDHEYYLKNKKRIIKRVYEWKMKHPEALKKWKQYYKEVWYVKNKDKMNELMRKQYHVHKDKWYSRSYTRIFLKSKKNINLLAKECKKCGGKNNLHLHYETYPKDKKEIIKAIKEKKLYYLCKPCRRVV